MTHTHRCVDCGDRYLFTRVYKGNYCPACHERWTARPPTTPSLRRYRFGCRESSTRTAAFHGPVEATRAGRDDPVAPGESDESHRRYARE